MAVGGGWLDKAGICGVNTIYIVGLVICTISDLILTSYHDCTRISRPQR